MVTEGEGVRVVCIIALNGIIIQFPSLCVSTGARSRSMTTSSESDDWSDCKDDE